MNNDGGATNSMILKIDLQKSVRPGTAVAILQSLSAEVGALHASGRIHRSMTLAAIEQDSQGSFRLTPPLSICWIGRVPITSAWLPPELRGCIPLELPANLDAATATLASVGTSLDPRQIDIYQLGALLCQLVTGESAQSYLRSLRTKMLVPESLRPIIERALGCDGNSRFGTAEEFSESLKSVSAEFADKPANVERTNPDSSHKKPDTTPSRVASSAGDTDVSLGPVARPQRLEASDVRPFAKLGHYEILSRIGQGGMGDVFLGYERSLDRKVAIKVLPAEFARQTDFVRRFRAEATAAAKLVHPNIIQIFFIGETDGYHFFAMQFVEGESLADLLKRRGKLKVERSLAIVEQVFAGLAAAHKLGLVHRDIKPGNILLDRQHRRALLADFGLVKSLHASSTGKTVTGVVMGTADYMPPEQARGKEVDHRADLYSMGVLMYQMLSGRLPFEADSPTALIFQHVYETPPSLNEIAPDVPTTIIRVIEKLLRKTPDERQQSADEVLAELRKMRSGEVEPIHRSTSGSKAPAQDSVSGTNADGIPLSRTSSTDIQSMGLWERLRDRAASLLHRHSPEILQQLQNTQQQVGGAIAEYERRQRKCKQLAREAEAILAELQTQAVTQRAAAKSDPAMARTADELEGQVADQEEQLGSIRLKLAKVNATLQQLKNQRDLLNARLRTAEAGAKISGGGTRKSLGNNKVFRAGGAAVMLCLAVAVFLFSKMRSESSNQIKRDPVATQHSAKEVATRGPSDAVAEQHPSMAVAPFNLAEAIGHSESWSRYLGVPIEYTNSIGMKFRLIPPGEFMMGATADEVSDAIRATSPNDPDFNSLIMSTKSESPQHKVILTTPIYMSVCEVTQHQYQAVMGLNPSYYSKTGQEKSRVDMVAQLDTANHPVENVNWDDASAFPVKLSQLEGLQPFPAGMIATGTGYRLPTEAEWEFAARAGSTGKFWFGESEKEVMKAGWIDTNSDGRTHTVGTLAPNAFGLFDVHGNVWEWCQDNWDSQSYFRVMQNGVNPIQPYSGEAQHMLRGGSFYYSSSAARSSRRVKLPYDSKDWNIGFRIVLSVDGVRAATMRTSKASSPTNPTTANIEPLPPGSTDMLAQVDLSRDVFAGNWQKNGASLFGKEGGKLYLPVRTPEDYQMKFNLKRFEGRDALSIGFVMAGRQGVMAFDFGGANRSGLYLDGLEPASVLNAGGVFADRVPASITLTVHPKHLNAAVDGKTIVDWHGIPDRLFLHSTHAMPSRESPFIVISNSKYQIATATLTPIEPESMPSRLARLDALIDVIPRFELKRDSIRGEWTVESNTLVSPGTPLSRIYLPVEAPEEYTISGTVEFPSSIPTDPVLTFGVTAGTSICQIVFINGSSLGLDRIDGHRWNNNTTSLSGISIPPGVPVTFACTVTKQKVRFELDGRTLIDWRGDSSRLSLPTDWTVPDGRKIFIGSSFKFQIRDIKLGPPLALPSLPEHPPFSFGRPVDLLRLVNSKRDALSGTWTKDGTTLHVLGDARVSKLTIPCEVPPKYKLSMRVAREHGGKEDNILVLKLPNGAASAEVVFDYISSTISGIAIDDLGVEDPKNVSSRRVNAIPRERTEDIVAFVRKTGLRVVIGDKVIFDWKGNTSRLSPTTTWSIPSGRIGIGSWNSKFRFEKIELEPLESSAFPAIAELGDDGNLLSIIEPLRDSQKGEWEMKDALVSPALKAAQIQIPVSIPDRYVLTANVERKTGRNDFFVGLVVGGNSCSASIDGIDGTSAGLVQLDDKPFYDNANPTGRKYSMPLLPVGQAVDVRCFVLPDTVIVICGDKEVIRWHGDPRRLSRSADLRPTNYSGNDLNHLWLGAWESEFAIRSLKLKPLNDEESARISKSFSGVFPMTSQLTVPLQRASSDLILSTKSSEVKSAERESDTDKFPSTPEGLRGAYSRADRMVRQQPQDLEGVN